LFLAVFGAVLLAVLLGNQLARPLLMLAEGVRDVAAGDLSPKPALQGRDELGGLTRSFALMTQQLADARSAVDRSMLQVHTSRANLQTILDNLTAGVIVLTEDGRIKSSNPGATRILRVPLAAWEGRALSDIEGLVEFAEHVRHEFDGFLGERSQHGLDHWQQSFELHATSISPAVQLSDDKQQHITLLARGAVLPNNGRLLVFDDISEIVSAQRAQAWGEVARRLAHEIKNPLTPIQLSAERLEMKLTGKLQEPEQLILNKSVKTIVDQVDAMKRLVNEFATMHACLWLNLNRLTSTPWCKTSCSYTAQRMPQCLCMPSWMRRAPSFMAMRSSCAKWCTTCCKTHRMRQRGNRIPWCRSPRNGCLRLAVCAWWSRTTDPASPLRF
jgi:nitrogen fixation/metabolism regulation signal transduction histidine kinase